MELLTLADDDLLSNVRRYVSTQSIALDKLIGWPGIPCGRITEIVGDEHTGKSTLLDHIFSQTQMEGGVGVLVDPEVSRNREYTERIGVKAKDLLIGQPTESTIESTWRFCAKTIRIFQQHPEILLTLGVDSIANVPTESQLDRADKEDKSDKPGDAAKAIKSGLRVLVSLIARRQVAMVLVNQFYEVVGQQWGDNRKSYGGRGLRQLASLRIQLKHAWMGGSKSNVIKDKTGRVVGHIVEAKILKTRLNGHTGATGRFCIMSGQGVDNVWTLFEAFKAHGYIASGGGWHQMLVPGEADALRWQGGHFGLRDICHEHPELFKQLVQIYQEMPGII